MSNLTGVNKVLYKKTCAAIVLSCIAAAQPVAALQEQIEGWVSSAKFNFYIIEHGDQLFLSWQLMIGVVFFYLVSEVAVSLFVRAPTSELLVPRPPVILYWTILAVFSVIQGATFAFNCKDYPLKSIEWLGVEIGDVFGVSGAAGLVVLFFTAMVGFYILIRFVMAVIAEMLRSSDG